VNETATDTLSKIPAVTLGFWVIKIAATTLGETGGDAVTMTMNLGYLIGTLIFGAILIAPVSTQILAKRFQPFLYWAVVVATTTVGTTLADFVDRSLGIGYGWLDHSVRACPRVPRSVVSGLRICLRRHRGLAEGRTILLDDHAVLADAWHGARRLVGGRHRARL
jgi:hypothetical protein